MTEFSVFIPTLPPTTNQAYRCGKGRFYMTEEGKAWKTAAQLLVQVADRQPEGFWRGKQLYVSLIFFDESVLMADVDGRAKLALDSVAAGLGFDDRYVFPLLLDKKKGIAPGVSVFVTDRIPHNPLERFHMERIPVGSVGANEADKGKRGQRSSEMA